MTCRHDRADAAPRPDIDEPAHLRKARQLPIQKAHETIAVRAQEHRILPVGGISGVEKQAIAERRDPDRAPELALRALDHVRPLEQREQVVGERFPGEGAAPAENVPKIARARLVEARHHPAMGLGRRRHEAVA